MLLSRWSLPTSQEKREGNVMTMEAAARALGALERNDAVCDQLLAPLKRMTALQVSHPHSCWQLDASACQVCQVDEAAALAFSGADACTQTPAHARLQGALSRCSWCRRYAVLVLCPTGRLEPGHQVKHSAGAADAARWQDAGGCTTQVKRHSNWCQLTSACTLVVQYRF